MSSKSMGKKVCKKPRRIGYVRIPQGENSETFSSVEYLKEFGKLDLVFCDKTISETGIDDVVEYPKMLKTIRRGDILVVPWVHVFYMHSPFKDMSDYVFEIAESIYSLHERGVHLVVLRNGIDTSRHKYDGVFGLCDALMGLFD